MEQKEIEKWIKTARKAVSKPGLVSEDARSLAEAMVTLADMRIVLAETAFRNGWYSGATESNPNATHHKDWEAWWKENLTGEEVNSSPFAMLAAEREKVLRLEAELTLVRVALANASANNYYAETVIAQAAELEKAKIRQSILERENERAIARIAELESSDSGKENTTIISLVKNIKSLMQERGELKEKLLASYIDDPSLDGTPNGHPAWWRAHEYTTAHLCSRVHSILNRHDTGEGVSNEPWHSVRVRLFGLVCDLAAAKAEIERLRALMEEAYHERLRDQAHYPSP